MPGPTLRGIWRLRIVGSEKWIKSLGKILLWPLGYLEALPFVYAFSYQWSFCFISKLYSWGYSPFHCIICKESKNIGHVFPMCPLANGFCGTLLSVLHSKVAFPKSFRGFSESSLLGHPYKKEKKTLRVQLIQSFIFGTLVRKKQ